MTIFVSTPYMDEASKCDRIALINHGNVFTIDTPQNIVNDFEKEIYQIEIAKTHGDIKFELLKKFKHSENNDYIYPAGEFLHFVPDSVNTESVSEKFNNFKGLNITKIKPDIEDCFINFSRENG